MHQAWVWEQVGGLQLEALAFEVQQALGGGVLVDQRGGPNSGWAGCHPIGWRKGGMAAAVAGANGVWSRMRWVELVGAFVGGAVVGHLPTGPGLGPDWSMGLPLPLVLHAALVGAAGPTERVGP